MNYQALKSGTDIRGKAVGENALITEQVAEQVGHAFVGWLNTQQSEAPRIAIGRDSRISGERLLAACARGMADAGAQVFDFGLCTTPAMYQSLQCEQLSLSASIMVTASHHPFDRNGFKFFTRDKGGISSGALDEIIALLSMGTFAEPAARGAVTFFDYLSVYCDRLARLIRDKLETDVTCPLLGLHVVVDAGNGAGGFYEKLLRELGAWTEGSQFLEPDGHFPNHIPNPEDGKAMASISAAVRKAGADMGVIFDADCDRVAIVDGAGKEINRNRLIALVAAVLLDKEPGVTIVTDSVTSSGLSKFIGEWGGSHYRYKRGYRNVIDEAIRLNHSGVNCPLAMETSGHAAFRDNGFIDDGMYLSTVLICEAIGLKQEGKSLFSLIDGLEEPVESAELRLAIAGNDFHGIGLKLIEKVMDYAEADDSWHIAPDNREGVRISFDLENGIDNGWFLLRMSVHDPVMPLNVESDVPGGVKQMLAKLYSVMNGTPDVDLSSIEAMLK